MIFQRESEFGPFRAEQGSSSKAIPVSAELGRAPAARSLLAGCALLGAGFIPASEPSLIAAPHGVQPDPVLRTVEIRAEPGPRRPAFSAVSESRTPTIPASEASPDSTFRPIVRVALDPAPAPMVAVPTPVTAGVERAEEGQALASAPSADPALEVAAMPLAAAPRPLVIEVAGTARSPVYIEQVAEARLAASHPAQMPETRERVSMFASKADIMQIQLPPPPELAELEAAGFVDEAPVEMTVRLGSQALGRVMFRMSEEQGIDVQLSGLLDLVSDRFTPDDFGRLRSSVAADSFVSIDQLREAGLNLRYDPVYDELRLSA